MTTMMLAFPASWAKPATLVSCSVTPSVASIMIRHTSLRSMAMVARRTLYFSMSSSTLDFFADAGGVDKDEPALDRFQSTESMASRVVPATLETMTRSSPRMRLTREDLPALGLPITATLMASSSLFFLLSSGGNTARRRPADRRCRGRGQRRQRWGPPVPGYRTRKSPGPGHRWSPSCSLPGRWACRCAAACWPPHGPRR